MSHLGLKAGAVVRVKYDYKATSVNALNLKKGEYLVVMRTKGEDENTETPTSNAPVWVAGCKVGGESGYFPSNYVEIIGGPTANTEENIEESSAPIEGVPSSNDSDRDQPAVESTNVETNERNSGASDAVASNARVAQEETRVEEENNHGGPKSVKKKKLQPRPGFESSHIKDWLRHQIEFAVLSGNMLQLELAFSVRKQVMRSHSEAEMAVLRNKLELERKVRLLLSSPARNVSLDTVAAALKEGSGLNHRSAQMKNLRSFNEILQNKNFLAMFESLRAPMLAIPTIQAAKRDQVRSILKENNLSQFVAMSVPINVQGILSQLGKLNSIYARVSPSIILLLSEHFDVCKLVPPWTFSQCESITTKVLTSYQHSFNKSIDKFLRLCEPSYVGSRTRKLSHPPPTATTVVDDRTGSTAKEKTANLILKLPALKLSEAIILLLERAVCQEPAPGLAQCTIACAADETKVMKFIQAQ
jgi:hypothetical protein